MHYDLDPQVETPSKILEDIIKNLVEYPDEVEIDVLENNTTMICSIDVVPEDRGKIIGRGGCIIESLKTVFNAVGCKRGGTIVLNIKE